MSALPDLMREFYINAVGVFKNAKAFIVQFYTEANVKSGLQYAMALRKSVPAGTTSYFVVKVGNNPVSVKALDIHFVGKEIATRVLKGATYTQGNKIDVYNQNDRNPVAGEVTIFQVTNVTGGADAFTPRSLLGVESTNQTPAPPLPIVVGLEFILAENTEYIFSAENISSSDAAEMETFMTWYEGGLDYPA